MIRNPAGGNPGHNAGNTKEDNMRRMTVEQLKKAIPKKYHHKLDLREEMIDWEDGRIFISTNDGYRWDDEGLHLSSFGTLKELKDAVRWADVCHCEDCERAAGARALAKMGMEEFAKKCIERKIKESRGHRLG